MSGAVEQIHAYAEAGIAVLPLHAYRNGRCTCRRPDCHSPAKHPLTRKGKDDATHDHEQIDQWAARWPGCNWGGRPPKDVVILDVDLRNDGDKNLTALETRHGALPATLTAFTGSGGSHLWLSYNGPARGLLCPGVDVKTNTGYVVLPPSVHACGGTYQWATELPAAYAPKWVVDILNPPIRHTAIRGDVSVIHLARFVAAAPAGERNRSLFWAACRAVESNSDVQPLIDAAMTVGLSHTEANVTIRSAQRAAHRKAA